MIGGEDVVGREDEAGAGSEPVRTVVVHVGDDRPARRGPRLPRRVLLAGLAVVVLIAVVVGALVLLGGSGGRHADGAGILASTRSPDAHNTLVRPDRSTGPMTGAVRLCLQQGTAPAVIEAVGPDKTVGSGWNYLGASVRVFTPSAGHSVIVSMAGYPPALPDELQPAAGFSVTTPCGDVGNGPYTELLIGLAPTGPAGGGWDGILVTYRVGGTRYVLAVGQAFVECGTAALPGYCGGS
ncbi:MAG TPA: hypothetical protein VJ506_09995 [Candidatus Limnocylindrales bacterium]|nr:hypothetical protein [Candidatus Limnocylindrales bacterium]